MKKLMFAVLMLVSFQAVAEVAIPYHGRLLVPVEFTSSYNLPVGGFIGYADTHAAGCIPPVLSIESGGVSTAVWLIGLSPQTFSVRIQNVGPSPEAGVVKIRFGTC